MYSVTDPVSAFANPTLVLLGLPPSLLKLRFPLKLDDRAAGRVVCSTNTPVFRLCAPFSFVTLPETFQSVL